MDNAIYSSMVRAGRTTYFIDVREAKNGKKFLSISESRLDADDKKSRTTIRVFSDCAEQFRQAVVDAAAEISK